MLQRNRISDAGVRGLVEALEFNLTLQMVMIEVSLKNKEEYSVKISQFLVRNRWIRQTDILDTRMTWQRFSKYPKKLQSIAMVIMHLWHAPEKSNQLNRLSLELVGYLLDSFWLLNMYYII